MEELNDSKFFERPVPEEIKEPVISPKDPTYLDTASAAVRATATAASYAVSAATSGATAVTVAFKNIDWDYVSERTECARDATFAVVPQSVVKMLPTAIRSPFTQATSFRSVVPLARRMAITEKALEVHPGCVPVIVERASWSNLKHLDKKQYLVPSNMTGAMFMFVIRRRLNMPSHQGLWLTSGSIMLTSCCVMGEFYSRNRAPDDRFLYICYYEENVFG